MAVNHIFVGILAIVNALAGTMQLISLPWWLQSFGSDVGGPYPILVISSCMYVIGFGLAFAFVWVKYYRRTGMSISLLFGMPQSLSLDDILSSPAWTLLCIGFNDAMNGVLAVTAGGADRTPPILGTILASMIIPVSMLLSRFYLHETRSFGRDAYMSALMCIMSVYVTLMPAMNQDISGGETMGQVLFWCSMTVVSMIPGALYNAQQKKYVLQQHDVLAHMHKALSEGENENLLGHDEITHWSAVHLNLFTLMMGCAWQLFFMLFFFWINVVNVPSLNWNGVSMSDLGTSLSSGFGCFFGAGDAGCWAGRNTMYGLLFNLGYFSTYIASIYLNLINLPLSMLTGQISAPLSALLLLLIPSLNLNPSGAFYYSVIPALVLNLAALWVYELWRQEKAEQDEVEVQREHHKGGGNVLTQYASC
jgi:hypothetical protein